MKTFKLLLAATVGLSLMDISALGQSARVAPSALPPATPKPPKAPTAVIELDVLETLDEPRISQRAVEAVRKATDNLFLTRSSSKSTRTLIIPQTQVDASEYTEMEEDLLVMWRILDKALRRAGEDGDKKSAMGIELSAGFGSSSSPIRNLYLEGYGALFMLRAKFPLIPPPDKPEEPIHKESTNSEWEEARRDVYGTLNPYEAELGKSLKVFTRSSAVEYDASKVDTLKSAMIESLKNGANIRHLKPEEALTIIVLGTEAKMPGGGGGSHGETTLLLRVKKRDMEEYNTEKLSTEDFQKKVQVITYFRRSSAPEAGYGLRTL